MNSRRVIRFSEDVVATLADLLPTSPTAAERALGQRLAEQLQALARSGETGAGSAYWLGVCRALADLARGGDPMFFMRWPPIRETMVHGATISIFADWWMLRRSPDWRRIWAPALRHRQVGHPPPFLPMLSTNAMAVEHATHLFHYRAGTGQAFQDTDCVIEFGGGYGSMCRLIHALGFRGRYIIFDLPHILALQTYYLGLHGIRAGTTDDCQVRTCSTIEDVAALLDCHAGKPASMISTWAMSEMPLPLRARIEPFLSHPKVGRVLLAYQATFEGNDNRAYFTGLAARSADRQAWLHRPVARNHAEIPLDQAGDCYLFGTRRPP